MSGDPHPVTEVQASQHSVVWVLKLAQMLENLITNDPNRSVHASLEINDLVDGEPVSTKFVFYSGNNYDEKESDRG